MLDKKLVDDLFQLWKDLAEAGELHIGKGYSKKMQVLEERVKKYNGLHSVVSRYTLEFEHKCGITGNLNEIEYVTWAKTLDDALDNLKEEYPNAKGVFISIEK